MAELTFQTNRENIKIRVDKARGNGWPASLMNYPLPEKKYDQANGHG